MEFKFKARSPNGGENEGRIEASSREKAIEILQKHKLVIIYIKPAKKLFDFRGLFIFRRIGVSKLVIFSKEVSTMLTAGIPLSEALKIEYQQEENVYFKDQLFSVASKVSDGMPFSEALASSSTAFSDFYVNMVRAGEISGKLQESFLHLSDFLEKQHYLTSKIKSSLMYPAAVVIGFVLVGMGMMYFVVPQLVGIFKDSSVELPITTKILIWTSNFLQKYIILIVVLSIAGFISFKNYIKTQDGKEKWDSFILKIPVFNKLLVKFYIARFTGNLSMLIESGIPIMDALRISGDIVGNEVYKEIIYSSVDEVKIGGSVAYVFERSERFPVSVSRMMRIGEKTGKLDQILKDIAKFYTKEVDIAMEGLLSLIEPILIFALGAGVLILVSAILLPIYQLTETM